MSDTLTCTSFAWAEAGQLETLDAGMDDRVDIWNVLHDGSITAVEQTTQQVRMFVSIPYLRRRFQPLGDSFVLTLSGVSACEFEHFDGERMGLPDTLSIGEPEILSTSSESLPVTVHTTLGQLRLSFEEMNLSLDTGEQVTFASVARAARDYWEEFAARGSGV